MNNCTEKDQFMQNVLLTVAFLAMDGLDLVIIVVTSMETEDFW
jgi:hypothetical protein